MHSVSRLVSHNSKLKSLVFSSSAAASSATVTAALAALDANGSFLEDARPLTLDYSNNFDDNSNTALMPAVSDLLHLFSKNPPQLEELSSAISTLDENPELFDSCLPPQFQHRNHELRETVLNGVRQMLSDPHLLRQTCAKIGQATMQPQSLASVELVKIPESTVAQSTATAVLDGTVTWDALCDEFRTCTICLDLLAAPTIINCGHSFCGLCIDDYMASCRAHECNVDVVHCCPNDRSEFNNATFERLLDSLILRKVESLTNLTVSETKLKEEWLKRRDAYLVRIGEKTDQQALLDKARSANSSPRGTTSGSSSGENDNGEEEDDGEVAEFLAFAVPAVAVAVLVLLYFCRTRR